MADYKKLHEGESFLSMIHYFKELFQNEFQILGWLFFQSQIYSNVLPRHHFFLTSQFELEILCDLSVSLGLVDLFSFSSFKHSVSFAYSSFHLSGHSFSVSFRFNSSIRLSLLEFLWIFEFSFFPLSTFSLSNHLFHGFKYSLYAVNS